MGNLRHQYTYEVESGNTFYEISQKFGISMDELASANPHIDDINMIHPGDKINVPSSFGGSNEMGIDYNDDGYIDNNYIDLDNDGSADLMTVDNNADNFVDNIYTLNSTNPANEMGIDYDGDGYADNNMIDFDNDGIADAIASDYDGDGYADDVTTV